MNFLREIKCNCGREHKVSVDDVIIEKGAIKRIPEILKRYNSKKPFIVEDKNTYNACGKFVEEILKNNNIEYSKHMYLDDRLEPTEKEVGSCIMHFDTKCDLVLGIGSGVINDISKIVSNVTKLPYVIVGTSPSMDGYASATSSVARDGLKVSIDSKCPNVIIGDIDILKNAPMKMLKSGLGDMLAKYVSIAEWRISNVINGEYYCDNIASIIREAVKKCVDNVDGLINRDEKAIESVFEGLVLGGLAMAYAGCSRPASGVEHYFSHIWDMRAIEFNTPWDFHGIQCAIGTLYSVRLYEKFIKIKPNKEKALDFVKAFNYEEYEKDLRNYLGKSADQMIEKEVKEKKYDKTQHALRLDKILSSWDKLKEIVNEELISSKDLEKILDTIKAPKSCEDIGLDKKDLFTVFSYTKDIRDKYVLSRLCWDLGVIDELKELINNDVIDK